MTPAPFMLLEKYEVSYLDIQSISNIDRWITEAGIEEGECHVLTQRAHMLQDWEKNRPACSTSLVAKSNLFL